MGRASKVGSLPWARESKGALTPAQALSIAAGGVRAQLNMAADLLRRALRLTPIRATRINLDAIRIPDSTAATQSFEHAQALSTPALFNHCLRTYVWGAMRAQMDGLRYDEEFFFVACALHDLGVTDTHHGEDKSCACFAVEGARLARNFSERFDWDEGRREGLEAAIATHINLRVELEQGTEAHLLHEGAGMDVAGLNAGLYSRELIDKVVAQYPRLGFTDAFIETMRQEAKMRPRSRSALMMRLGYVPVIRTAPFAE